MSTFLKSFVKKNKPQFQKYQKYFKDNDWSKPQVVRNNEGKITYSKYYYIKDIKFKGETLAEGKEPEYKIQHKIATTILDRLKHFVQNTEADRHDSKVKTEINRMLSIIKIHINRIDDYISSSSVLGEVEITENDEKKTQKDYQSDEIEFDDMLYKNQAKLNDEITKLNIDNQNNDSILELRDNKKAPLSLREAIENEYPEVRKKVESLGIDFTSPPKNEMLIHIENPPVWNEEKHYFEQDKKTLQFYVDEFKKIRNGITIDGVYITPWMYCHLNVFKTDIPVLKFNERSGIMESNDEMMNPPLRDNEWFIIQDSFQNAQKENRMMFLCATRRAAKTTLIASHLQWSALKGGKELIVAGGSAKDLGQIEKNFKKTVINCNPAFELPNTSGDWTKKIELGVKKRNQKNITFCTLNIINLDSGGDSKSEVLAGFTPDAFVLDECMKAPFIKQLEAAKPAFESGGVKRCVPILSGTGGNENLSKDALTVLKDPEKEDITEMDWDALERNIPKEHITWKRRKFGTFLPAQMSVITLHTRKEISLNEYLSKEGKKLSKIKIQVTDWGESYKILKQRREDRKNNKLSLTKEKVYFPINPEEIFLSGKTNPFPQEEIKLYKEKLIETGDVGRKVVLGYDKQDNIVITGLSDKDYPDVPFSGGFHDSPPTIYEEPLPNAPFGFYLCGLDDYKFEEADGDSLGSFTIIRRDNGKIVASLHTRPDPHALFYKTIYMLIQMYNAPVFMENADMGFKTFLDGLGSHITDKYLIKSFDGTSEIDIDNNGRRQFGWTPTKKNKDLFFGILNTITKKTDTYEDENGNPQIKWGFERYKDIRVLDEMINYRPGENVDTIISLMSATGADYYFSANGMYPKVPLTDEEIRLKEKRLQELKNNRKPRGLFPQGRRRQW